MQKIKDNNKSYTILDCLLLFDCKLKVLDKLFYINKNNNSFFLYLNSFIIQK